MTLTLNRIFHSFHGRGGKTIPRLDTLGLGARDLADLNLPADIRLHIENAREVERAFIWR
jgi:hypothetical protein